MAEHHPPVATLIFTLDDGHEIPVELEGRITLGSEEGNDVCVEGDGVAGHHAEIVATDDGHFELRDLGSEAGTLVNGRPVKTHTLVHGDALSFGPLHGKFLSRAPSVDKKDQAPATAAPALENEHAAEKKLKELRESYNGLLSQHRVIESVVSSLAEQEKERLTALQNLHNEVAGHEHKLATLQDQLRSHEEALHESGAQRQQLADTIAELDSHQQHLHDEIETHEQKLTALQDTLRDREVALENAGAALHESGEKRKELADTIAGLESKHGTHNERLQTLSGEVADTEARIEELRVLAEANQDKVHASERKIQATEKQREELEQRVQKLAGTEERLLHARSDLQTAQSSHAALAPAIAKLETDHADRTTLLQSVHKRLAQVQKDHALELSVMSRKREEFRNFLVESKAFRRRAEAETQKLEKEIREKQSAMHLEESVLKETIQKLAEEERSMRRRFDEVRKFNENSEHEAAARISAMEVQIKKRQDEVAALESQHASLQSRNNELDEHYGRLASLPKDSPEGLKLWEEIQQEKEDAVQTAGIQPRANAEVRVVPRGKRSA